MRRTILPYVAVTVLLSSCAYQGVVVEKRFRPVPFEYSLGLDAIYNFKLRDNTGQTNSQMVTADVFANYRVGDYFNDMQAPPAHDDKELEGFRIPPPELREGPYQPVRVMQIRMPQKPAANVAFHAYDRADTEMQIPRWQTVKIVPIRAPERVVAKIVLHAPEHVESGVKIPRTQMVRIAQIQSPETPAVKIAVHATDHIENGIRIPRWQTVRIVHKSPQTIAAKVAIRAPGHVENEVKILRWQTVRVIQMPPQKAAARIANPAQRHARSAGKTPAFHERIKQFAKVARHRKNATTIASADHKHHRRAVASVN